MNIKIEKPAPERLEELKVKTWPTLEKEACTINWYFDQIEESYFLEGRIIVVTEDGQEVEVKKEILRYFPRDYAAPGISRNRCGSTLCLIRGQRLTLISHFASENTMQESSLNSFY